MASTRYIDNKGFINTTSDSRKIFSMIDNYMYLYHTDTFIILPSFPENIQDSLPVTFGTTQPLARSAPIYSYQNSGPRSITVQLQLQREMFELINTGVSNLTTIPGDDYVETFIKQIQAAALPKYGAAEKMVDPPIVAVRFGNEIFCKGVISGAITLGYNLPILSGKYDNKYSMIEVGFTINEIDPYSATDVMNVGSFRGLDTSLERRIYKSV